MVDSHPSCSFLLMLLWVRNLKKSSAENCSLRVSHADVGRCWLGLPSSEDWTSKTAHSCGWSWYWLLAKSSDYWSEALHMPSPAWWSQTVRLLLWRLSSEWVPPNNPGRRWMIFYLQASEGTQHTSTMLWVETAPNMPWLKQVECKLHFSLRHGSQDVQVRFKSANGHVVIHSTLQRQVCIHKITCCPSTWSFTCKKIPSWICSFMRDVVVEASVICSLIFPSIFSSLWRRLVPSPAAPGFSPLISIFSLSSLPPHLSFSLCVPTTTGPFCSRSPCTHNWLQNQPPQHCCDFTQLRRSTFSVINPCTQEYYWSKRKDRVRLNHRADPWRKDMEI